MKLQLFKQNPTEEKYKPDSALRQMESLDIDRKEDLEKFRSWMEGAAKEKSELPDQKELDELNKEATKSKGTGMGLLGAVAAIGGGGLAFAALGGMGGISSMVSDAMSFITGGGVKTSTGSGDDILGIKKSEVESLTPAVPDLSKVSTALSGKGTQSQPTSSPPPVPALKPTVVLAGGTNSAGNPNKAATEMTSAIEALQKKGYKVVVIPPDSESSQFSPSSNAIAAAAQAQGATVERGQYGGDDGTDRLHLTPQSAKEIRDKYSGATFMGDSNAVRLANYSSLQGVRREGAGTSEIVKQAQGLPQAAPPTQPLKRSSQTTQNQVSTGTGNVNQWLHGNPGRAGYDAGHAGQANAHDHFSFNSRASAVAAYKALKAAGYQITEFEGYGKYTRNGMREGSHSPGGGHFGSVGGAPTYNDISDGTAFDIPWSSYGSGPITQKDYDLSFKAAQIVGAVGGGGSNVNPDTSNLTESPGTGPNYAQGRTEQQQPNMFQQLTDKVKSIFKIFEYMGDKELMDKTVIYGRDPETGLPTTKSESFNYDSDLLEMIQSYPKDSEISRLTPEAEAAQERVLIVQGDQITVQNGAQAAQPTMFENAPDKTESNNQMLLIGSGSDIHDTYKRLLATKIG